VTAAGASVYCTAGTISPAPTPWSPSTRPPGRSAGAATPRSGSARSPHTRTRSTPTYLGYDGGLCAWDAATGDTRWEHEPQPLTSLLLRTAPVVDGDTCYVAGEQFTPGDAGHRCTLFAHDAATGEPRWSVRLDAVAGPEPALAAGHGTAVLGTMAALLGVG